MATVTAAGSGNWSSTTPNFPWPSGTLPVGGDTVECGGFILTPDQTITVGTIKNTAGGKINVPTGAQTYTINANLVAVGGPLLTLNHTSGTITVSGNVTGGGGAVYYGINNISTGIVTIYGNLLGGSNATAYAAYNTSTGVINVTGNVTGGTAVGLYGNGNGNINVTGTVYGKAAFGIRYNGLGICTVTGATVGSDTTSSTPGVYTTGATVNIVGTAVGGTQAGAHGVSNNGAGTVSVSSTATGGTGDRAYGANNSSNGTLTVNTAVGNDFGPGGPVVGMSAGVYGSSTTGAVTQVKAMIWGAYGQIPISGSVLLTDDISTNSATVTLVGLTTRALLPTKPRYGDMTGGL
jgi:hypothetical protein